MPLPATLIQQSGNQRAQQLLARLSYTSAITEEGVLPIGRAAGAFDYGWSDLKVVGQGSQSPVRFKVPNSSKIRIVSTNPVVVSNERPAPTGYQLRAVIPPTNYSPYTLTYTDGTRNYAYANEGSWQASQSGLKPLQTTTYRLVGVTNVCGPGLIEGKATFTVVPLRIKTVIPREYSDGQYYSYSVCGTGSLSVPFVTDVAPPAGTTFTLQIAFQKGLGF